MNISSKCDGECLCPEAERIWRQHLAAYNLAIHTNDPDAWLGYAASGLAYKNHVQACNPAYFGHSNPQEA